MHSDVYDSLRLVLPQALERAAQVELWEIPRWVLRRTESGWQSSIETYRDLPPLSLEEIAVPFQRAMEMRHPKHLGPVGTVTLQKMRRGASDLLEMMVKQVRGRQEKRSTVSDAVEEVLVGFSGYLDASKVRISYIAPLLNLHVAGAPSEIPWPSPVKVVRLADEDVTALYCAPRGLDPPGGMVPWPLRWPDYAFAGEFEEPITFDWSVGGPAPERDRVKDALRRATIALRSFESGSVGHVAMHIRAAGFWPGIARAALWEGVQHLPVGSYDLSPEDMAPLRDHAERVLRPFDDSLDLALSRLSDAETRSRHTDRLLDSAIGLESILLGGTGGESTYRFAMNYAALADSAEDRWQRFERAKRVYSCRSALVHRKPPSATECKECADAAVEMLREVTRRFLSEGWKPSKLDSNWWTQRVLAAPTSS
jgi:hypothetical protein